MDDETHRLMAEYDLNNDGKLDLEEFSKMMNPLRASQGRRPT